MRSVQFAHITDVHVSERDTWGTIGTDGLALFQDTLKALNNISELDFVLLTGDLLNDSTPGELKYVQQSLALLEKPWHYTPGNHDGYIDPNEPEAMLPDVIARSVDPRLPGTVQGSFWSRSVKPGIRVIGLDSRLADHWNGKVQEEQQAWLRNELEQHPDDLIIVAIHHPLHNLGPHNEQEPFSNFIVDEGPEVEAILDEHPNVKMVLSGHHHVNQLRQHNARLHVSTAALTGYPCQYRMVTINEVADGWHVQITSPTEANKHIIERAHNIARNSDIAEMYNEADLDAWVSLCKGTPEDTSFEGILYVKQS